MGCDPGVERGLRLFQQHDPRRGHERSRNCQHLLLAAREIAAWLLSPRGPSFLTSPRTSTRHSWPRPKVRQIRAPRRRNIWPRRDAMPVRTNTTGELHPSCCRAIRSCRGRAKRMSASADEADRGAPHAAHAAAGREHPFGDLAFAAYRLDQLAARREGAALRKPVEPRRTSRRRRRRR